MIASQIIYTACGKTKKGDFETWSKSVDITAAEEEEICKKMSYKRLTEHPPYPTQEEIDEIFPKKFSYFKLSSGRYCIAMSTYVGKVYSDEDNRSGNYVMHGYVFDEPKDFVSVDFFAHEMFKQTISREEWCDIGAPASLPQVNFPDSTAGISDSDLREFFTPARLEKLKLLVQAVRNSLTTDEQVTFHDDYANIPYWYKGISLCFDKATQNELTFCTFFTPGYTNTTANPGAPENEVKIRNVHPSRPGSPQFIYQNEAADGKYAFNFEAGIQPANITVSNFVDGIVDFIVRDTDVMKTIVEEVGAICHRCGVDPDTALNVSYLLKGDLAALNDDHSLILSLIKIFEQYYPERIPDTADTIYNYAFRDGRWLLSSRIDPFFDFITENATVVTKADMVTLYLENLSAFGVREGADEPAYCQSIKECAPFRKWEYLENYLLVDEGLETYNGIPGSDKLKSFFVFHTYANALPRMKANDTYKKKIAVYVAKSIRDSIREAYETRELGELRLLCSVIERVEPTWPYNAINIALKNGKSENGGSLFDDFDKEFVLTLAEEFCGRNGAVALIIECVRSSLNSPDFFLPRYIAHESKNRELYAAVMNELMKDDSMQGFLQDLRFKKFEMTDNPSNEAFRDFFRNRFVKGEDEMDVFCSKMLTRLRRSRDVIEDCFDCMRNYIIPVKGTLDELCEERLADLASKMRELIYSQTGETIKAYVESHGLKSFDDLDALCSEPAEKPPVFDVLRFYNDVIRPYTSASVAPPVTNYRTFTVTAPDAQPEQTQAPVNPVVRFADEKKRLIPRDGSKTDDDEKNISAYIVKWYMDSIMKIYLKNEDPINFNEVFEVFFRGYRIDSIIYARSYVEAVGALNGQNPDPGNDYIRMLHATVVYHGICKAGNTPTSERLEAMYSQILSELFAAIQKKHAKHVITKLLEISATNPKWSVKQYDKYVNAYLADYQKKAKESTFFGKLAAKFQKKHESDEKKAQKAAEKQAKKGGAPDAQPEQESDDKE